MRVTKIYQFGHQPHACDVVGRQDNAADPLPITFTDQYSDSIEFKFANPASLQEFADELRAVAATWADDRKTWA